MTTTPMKRAYVRKDKSPEGKAVEFVESYRTQDVDRKLRDMELELVSFKRQLEYMNRELNKQQTIYNQNFADIEEAMKMSWSYRIRKFMGF